jgi:hypothetical protein
MELSLETYNRLYAILGEPPEPYLLGKVCGYHILKKLNTAFLNNLHQDYLEDYFLITDWKMDAFYNGNILSDFKESNYYRYDLPYPSFLLIWNAFNENHKELQGSHAEHFHSIRYNSIPIFIDCFFNNCFLNNFLQQHDWNTENTFPLLKDIFKYNHELHTNDYQMFYMAVTMAKSLGKYLLSKKNIETNILEYLSSLQNFSYLDIDTIQYSLYLDRIKKPERIDMIFKVLEQQNIDKEQLFSKIITMDNYQLIKYMINTYNLQINSEDITQILSTIKKSIENCEDFFLTVQPTNNLIEIMMKFYNSSTINHIAQLDTTYKDDFMQIIHKVTKRISYETLNTTLNSKSIEHIQKQKI